jgi:hypothetical protein
MRSLLLLFVPMAVLTACHECSTESCTDYASVFIDTNDGTWVDGEYSLELEGDGAMYSCTFTTPDDAPDETGTSRPLDCTPAIDAFLVPYCESYEIGKPPSENCSPRPGKFYLEARIPGTPMNLHIVLNRGDETVLERTSFIPLYATVQPNGPECGPTCQQYGTGYTIK